MSDPHPEHVHFNIQTGTTPGEKSVTKEMTLQELEKACLNLQSKFKYMQSKTRRKHKSMFCSHPAGFLTQQPQFDTYQCDLCGKTFTTRFLRTYAPDKLTELKKFNYMNKREKTAYYRQAAIDLAQDREYLAKKAEEDSREIVRLKIQREKYETLLNKVMLLGDVLYSTDENKMSEESILAVLIEVVELGNGLFRESGLNGGKFYGFTGESF